MQSRLGRFQHGCPASWCLPGTWGPLGSQKRLRLLSVAFGELGLELRDCWVLGFRVFEVLWAGLVSFSSLEVLSTWHGLS